MPVPRLTGGPSSKRKRHMNLIGYRSGPRLTALLSSLAALLLVVSCSEDRSEQPPSSEPANQETRIGVVLELTGALAPYAKNAKAGMEIAAEEPGDPIRLLFEDAGTDPKSGVSAFRKLRDVQKLSVISGAIGSSTVMACAPLANESQTLFFSCGATSPLN